MSIQAVLSPLFVLVTLTFVLLFWMVYLRTNALMSGEVRQGDVALRESNWPPRVAQVANAFHNQLELPVLFYLLTVLSLITRHADWLFVILAWIFVALRLVHAVIHVTTNNLSQRGGVFIVSAIVLAIMWAIFMVRILLGLG